MLRTRAGYIRTMSLQFAKKAVAIIVSLSVLWHCVVGCCSHHAHTQTACGSYSHGGLSCCVESACPTDHSECDHQNEFSRKNLDLASVSPGANSTSNHSPVDCQHGKCAFSTSISTTQDTTHDEVAFEVYICTTFDFVPPLQRIVNGNQSNLGTSALLCATAARLQQILCIWLI
jgi:hypothetical protein